MKYKGCVPCGIAILPLGNNRRHYVGIVIQTTEGRKNPDTYSGCNRILRFALNDK